jgi:RND superfamily putative drug exporter
MVFERLGHVATRYRLLIIAVWIATAVIVTAVAPNISAVASSNLADFLPSKAPFRHADQVYQATFPHDFAESNTVIVIDARNAAGGILNSNAATFAAQTDTEVGRFIRDLGAWLTGPDAPRNISGVVLPTDSPAVAALTIASATSGDPALANRVALVRVNLTTSASDPVTQATLDTIDSWLAAHQPPGVRTYQTGGAPLVTNTTESIQTSAARTIWVTVVLVIVMLLLVYRSPVSPVIPLAAVTIAYLITRGIVAYLGAHVMTITSYANVLLVTVMYGAGTDYCLFLISRFREEMADQPGLEVATRHTVHRVGETITSSAGTIFVGFMSMIFSEMGIFKTSGPALALGIAISLLSGLTLVPALLATLGDRAFWPGKATHRASGRLYELTSKWVSTRPPIVILVIVTIMVPLSIYGVTQRVAYDLMADLPKNTPVVEGFRLLQDSLGAGSVLPVTVVVTGRDPTHIAGDIVRLTDQLAALKGVSDVRGLNDPLGKNHPEYSNLLRVDTQLQLALNLMSSFQASGASPDAQQVAALLKGMQSYLDLLAQRFPEVANDPNLLKLKDLLANPLQLVTQRDALAGAVQGLAERFKTVQNPYLLPTSLGDLVAALPAQGNGLSAALFSQLASSYLAENGTAFKLDVILADSPSSYPAMNTLTRIRSVLKAYGGPGDAVASGGTAINTDIRDTMNRDLLRAIFFVLLGIFIVLLLMLRSLVAPIYLICTVVLSFSFTLGLTNLVFKTIRGVEGLTWYVPFFAFVFLVALGIDYSIFLFGRIKEEVGYHGIREGVHVSVATTGAIITSAGMILAGTFAAVMTAEVAGLVELGFAVAVGVLIDTFVVRTMLDPALATLFGHWTWWPGGVPKAKPGRRAKQVPAPGGR